MRWLLCALVLTSTTSAYAFECSMSEGRSIVWVNRCVPYRFAENDSFLAQDWVKGSADAAFAMWSSPSCTDLWFTDEGFGPEAPGYLRLATGESEDPNFFGGTISADTLSITLTSFRRSTGELTGATVVLNTDVYDLAVLSTPCTNEMRFDLTNVLAHEIGHAIGLATSSVAGSVMEEHDVQCLARRRNLGEDDRLGVCTIYPDGGPVTPCVPIPEGFEDNPRLSCEDFAGEVGDPCTKDNQCKIDLECDSAQTCRFLLQSRGCACSQEHEERPESLLPFIFGLLLFWLGRWRSKLIDPGLRNHVGSKILKSL